MVLKGEPAAMGTVFEGTTENNKSSAAEEDKDLNKTIHIKAFQAHRKVQPIMFKEKLSVYNN